MTLSDAHAAAGTYLLPASLLALAATIPIYEIWKGNLKQAIKTWAKSSVAFTVIAYIMLWTFKPSFVGPFWGVATPLATLLMIRGPLMVFSWFNRRYLLLERLQIRARKFFHSIWFILIEVLLIFVFGSAFGHALGAFMIFGVLVLPILFLWMARLVSWAGGVNIDTDSEVSARVEQSRQENHRRNSKGSTPQATVAKRPPLRQRIKDGFRDAQLNMSSELWVVTGMGVAIFILVAGRSIAGSEALASGRLAELVGPVEEKGRFITDFPVGSLAKQAIVEAEQAEYLGSRAVGQSPLQLGKRFTTGHFYKQLVRGELCWVAPLEYRDPLIFWTSDYSPGYVVVSAEDRFKPAQLVTELPNKEPIKLRFLQSAWSFSNLRRHLQLRGFQSHRIEDVRFELDEDLRPWWVVSLAEPTIHYGGDVVRRVIFLDPQTGETNDFALDDIPKQFDWCDAIIPRALAHHYVDSWARLKKGFKNQFGSKDGIANVSDLLMPQLIWDKHNRAHYVVPTLVTNSSGTSLTSLVLLDARTGRASSYKEWGLDEHSAMSAIDAAVQNFRYHAAQPAPWTIAGRFVYLAPIVSSSHLSQGFGIVDVEQQKVATGETKEETVRNMLQILGEHHLIPKEHQLSVEGTVFRLGEATRNSRGAKVILLKEHPGKSFVATNITVASTLARGDRVRLWYVPLEDSQEHETVTIEALHRSEER